MARRKRFGRVRRIGRRARGFRRGRDRRIPLLPVITGVVAPLSQSFAACGSNLFNPASWFKDEAWGEGIVDQLAQRYAGISTSPRLSGMTGWHPEMMFPTYMGVIGGFVGSKIASTLGVNRAIKKVPFVGRYIKL